LDSGANNPFILPTGFHMMSAPGGQDEFGYAGIINTRHTGSTTTLGTFKPAGGGSNKGQKFTGIAFEGTASTRCFVSTAQDASDNAYWQYVQFQNCSWDSFESVWTGTGTGILWNVAGPTYFNNMACTRPILDIAGSDHQLFLGGGFAEMGTVAGYSTRAILNSMFRFPNTNCTVGPLYITGSPTTPIRIDAGVTGLHITGAVLEGRPSPVVVGGDTPTDGLHCAGPLARITGGRSTFMVREHGYAMRDPRTATLGYQPGGFYHITGGSHSIIGGTFQPYPAVDYPPWTRPDGVAVAADQQPPLAWVSGSGTRLNINSIVRGSNCATAPVVFAHAGASVINDGSVTVTTVP
jgi:hypothetical protein